MLFLAIGGLVGIFYAPKVFISGYIPAKLVDPYPLRGIGIIAALIGVLGTAVLGFDIYLQKKKPKANQS